MQEKITAFLSKTPEASAKNIAAGIGESDAQSSVNSALNAMRTNGVVECEKRKGKGNELVYWLAKPVCTNSQTESALKHPEKVFTQPAHDDGWLEAARVRDQLKLAEKQRDEHFAEAEAAQKKVADLEDDVRRHTEAHSRLSTEISHFLTVVQQLTGIDHRPKNLAESEEQIATAFNMMRGRVEELELAVDVAQQAVASMELAEEQAANDAVDVKDAAIGYLVRVPGKKTRICIKPDNARNAALSAARAHGRADVLALVPVGKAVKGAEWKDAA